MVFFVVFSTALNLMYKTCFIQTNNQQSCKQTSMFLIGERWSLLIYDTETKYDALPYLSLVHVGNRTLRIMQGLSCPSYMNFSTILF